jgi:hypothetical protein
MKTTTLRETAKRAARMTARTFTPPARPAQAEVWPGLTRAQLRDIVIEQIG